MTTFLGKKNNAVSKVATVGGIDNSTDPVTFAVTTGEGSKFPASNFVITIDNEILLCTSRTGDNLTCTRAYEGTTIAAHSQNADVEARITAGTLLEYEKISNLHGMDFAADDQTSDAYVVTLAPAPTAYFTGMVVKFKANTLNTGACTLNVNSLGAKTLKKNYNSDLVTGDILAGQIVIAIYDGTNFQVLSVGSVPIATGAETTTGTDNTKAISPKALADADLNTRLKSKLMITSRDGTAASGDVSYTGCGFKPTAIIAKSFVSGTVYQSFGMADSDKLNRCNFQATSTTSYEVVGIIAYSDQVTFGQSAAVKSYDTDGFTLTWTKAASPPANTITIHIECFK